MPHVQLTRMSHLLADLTPYDVLITKQPPTDAEALDRIAAYVCKGGGWLLLVDLADQLLPSLCGVQAGPIGPKAELRVLFHDPQHPLAIRLPDAVYLRGRYHALEKSAKETEIILYADWHYGHSPVLAHRHVDAGQVACTTLQADDDPALQQTFTVVGSRAAIELPHNAFIPFENDAVYTVRFQDQETGREYVVPGADEYQLMVEHFVDVVLGRQGLTITPKDSIQNMRVLDALAEAARSGQTIRL